MGWAVVALGVDGWAKDAIPAEVGVQTDRANQGHAIGALVVDLQGVAARVAIDEEAGRQLSQRSLYELHSPPLVFSGVSVAAIAAHGVKDFHRRSFSNIAEFLKRE